MRECISSSQRLYTFSTSTDRTTPMWSVQLINLENTHFKTRHIESCAKCVVEILEISRKRRFSKCKPGQKEKTHLINKNMYSRWIYWPLSIYRGRSMRKFGCPRSPWTNFFFSFFFKAKKEGTPQYAGPSKDPEKPQKLRLIPSHSEKRAKRNEPRMHNRLLRATDNGKLDDSY